MNIILHFPKTEKSNRELEKRLAQAHAEAIKQQLLSLPHEPEKKIVLLQSARKGFY